MKPSGSDSKSDELAYHCALTFGGLVEKATMNWKYASNGTLVERVPPQHQMGGTISRSFFRSVEQLPEDQPLRCVTRFRVPAQRDRASNVPEAKCEIADRWQNGTDNVTRAGNCRPNCNVKREFFGAFQRNSPKSYFRSDKSELLAYSASGNIDLRISHSFRSKLMLDFITTA